MLWQIFQSIKCILCCLKCIISDVKYILSFLWIIPGDRSSYFLWLLHCKRFNYWDCKMVEYPHPGNMLESIFSWGEANNLKGDRLHIFKATILTYFWQIWKTRNGMVHDKNRLSIERMFILIKSLTLFWINSKKKLNRSLDWARWVCFPSSCL